MTLQASVAAVTAERDNAEAELQELSAGQTKATKEHTTLQSEKDALAAKAFCYCYPYLVP